MDLQEAEPVLAESQACPIHIQDKGSSIWDGLLQGRSSSLQQSRCKRKVLLSKSMLTCWAQHADAAWQHESCSNHQVKATPARAHMRAQAHEGLHKLHASRIKHCGIITVLVQAMLHAPFLHERQVSDQSKLFICFSSHARLRILTDDRQTTMTG